MAPVVSRVGVSTKLTAAVAMAAGVAVSVGFAATVATAVAVFVGTTGVSVGVASGVAGSSVAVACSSAVCTVADSSIEVSGEFSTGAGLAWVAVITPLASFSAAVNGADSTVLVGVVLRLAWAMAGAAVGRAVATSTGCIGVAIAAVGVIDAAEWLPKPSAAS